jgi:hypothetical protein
VRVLVWQLRDGAPIRPPSWRWSSLTVTPRDSLRHILTLLTRRPTVPVGDGVRVISST